MVASWLVARFPGGEVTGYPTKLSKLYGRVFLSEIKLHVNFKFWS